MISHTQYDFSNETAVVTGSPEGVDQAIAARPEHVTRITAGLTDAVQATQTRHETEQKMESDTRRTAEPLQTRGKRRPQCCPEQSDYLAGAVLWLASARAHSNVGDSTRTSGADNPA